MVEVLDEGIIAPPTLNWDRWNSAILADLIQSYDKQRDILFMHAPPKSPAVSLDVGGHFWIRYNPQTSEVIGVEIEDFEQVFLKLYPQLSPGWKIVKPRIIKLPKRTEVTLEEYLLNLMLFLKNVLKMNPQQLQMPA